MIKRILAGVAVGVATVAAAVAPALALDNPGIAYTINPSGGTSLSDGLKLDIASGQIQVGRNGSGQLYSDTSIPVDNNFNEMSNYFVVAFGAGDSVGDSSDLDANWDSFTSEATLTDGDKSGTVINHLSGENGDVLLDVTYTYTYPNEYLNVKYDLTLSGARAGAAHRVYWYTDSYLEGSDEGNQFGGTSPAGQTFAGVVSMAGTQIEAFRQTDGQNLKWFAGDYECPYTNSTDSDPVLDCTVDPGSDGFAGEYIDFPNAASTATAIDNGFGVNSAESTSNTESGNFDLIFASCLDGWAPLRCADEATGRHTLPDTGVSTGSAAAMVAGAAALAGVGFALVAIRRRRNA